MIIIISLCVVVATPFGFAHTRKKKQQSYCLLMDESGDPTLFETLRWTLMKSICTGLFEIKREKEKKHGHSVITSRNL